jgi:hypothetical protein
MEKEGKLAIQRVVRVIGVTRQDALPRDRVFLPTSRYTPGSAAMHAFHLFGRANVWKHDEQDIPNLIAISINMNTAFPSKLLNNVFLPFFFFFFLFSCLVKFSCQCFPHLCITTEYHLADRPGLSSLGRAVEVFDCYHNDKSANACLCLKLYTFHLRISLCFLSRARFASLRSAFAFLFSLPAEDNLLVSELSNSSCGAVQRISSFFFWVGLPTSMETGWWRTRVSTV